MCVLSCQFWRKPSNYYWWLKSCTTWDVWNPINNGTFTISTGAGFQPSTVCHGLWEMTQQTWHLAEFVCVLPWVGESQELTELVSYDRILYIRYIYRFIHIIYIYIWIVLLPFPVRLATKRLPYLVGDPYFYSKEKNWKLAVPKPYGAASIYNFDVLFVAFGVELNMFFRCIFYVW